METLESLTLARWKELLNARFEVRPKSGDPLHVELISITPGSSAKANSSSYESFSLIFRSGSAPVLPQGIYAFQTPKLGTLDLFMVPVAQNSQGVEYQVVINRLVKV